MVYSAAGVARRGAVGYAGGAVLVAAIAAAGCSSSGGSGSTSSPPSSGATSAASGSGSAPADAATTAAISTAFVTLFKSSTDPALSATLLQHGSVFKDVLVAQLNSPQAQNISATVSKVALQSPKLATVTFTLLSSGKPVLANTPGYAVQEGGTWKVAAGTFCALLKLEGSAPKACNDTSITALPD